MINFFFFFGISLSLQKNFVPVLSLRRDRLLYLISMKIGPRGLVVARLRIFHCYTKQYRINFLTVFCVFIFRWCSRVQKQLKCTSTIIFGCGIINILLRKTSVIKTIKYENIKQRRIILIINVQLNIIFPLLQWNILLFFIF